MSRAARQASTSTTSTTAKGRTGEDAAAAHLTRAGYRVLERNARVGRLELDIVAMDGDVLVFVEVRKRQKRNDALFSVNGKKQYAVAKAAARYLVTRLPPGAPPMCRFDVIVVSADGGLELVKNAFEAPPVRT